MMTIVIFLLLLLLPPQTTVIISTLDDSSRSEDDLGRVSSSRDAVLLAMHLASSDQKKLDLRSCFQSPQTSYLSEGLKSQQELNSSH